MLNHRSLLTGVFGEKKFLAFSEDMDKSKFSGSVGRGLIGPAEEFPWDEFPDEELFIECLGEMVVSLPLGLP